MLRQIVLAAFTLCGCVIAGEVEGDALPDPQEVDPVDDEEYDEEPGRAMKDLPPDDPFVIYERERAEFLAAVDHTPPPPRGRKARRKLRRSTARRERHCRRGQQRAEHHIRVRRLAWLGFGLPGPCWFTSRDRAADELGVSIVNMGCVITDESDAYASCYNTVMNREMAARGIDDDLERVFDEECTRGEE